MAKFVVAGRSDCPYFSRVELLGDRLAKNLEKFELHKILIQPHEWDEWLQETCAQKGWTFSKSPIVWRELIDRGGKGVLIGGANDFQEYVKAYYDLESEMNSYEMRMIANENKLTKDELDQEDQFYQSLSNPLYICISNAAHPITYHLMISLTSGKVLGPNEEIVIKLLVSNPEDVEFVTGIAMEVEDLAQALMRGVTVCTNPVEAFDRCSIIIMLDEVLQSHQELRSEWLIRNEMVMSEKAKIINERALKSCKVLVSGQGPINFNTMMMIKHMPNLQRQNIVAISTVLENIAKSVVGEQLTVNPGGIVDLLLWGNINGSHYFDLSKCRVHNYDGAIWGPYWFSVDAQEMIHDKKWVTNEFPILVGGRTKRVTEALNHSTSLSAGNAICMALQYWFQGSPLGQMFSLGVYSEGWYGVPEGLVFSLPVTMDPKGYWHVVQDFEITPELKQALTDAIKDLTEEVQLFKGEISDMEEEVAEKDGTKSTEKSKTMSPIPAADQQTSESTQPAQGEVGAEPSGETKTEGEANKAETSETTEEKPETETEGQAGEAVEGTAATEAANE